MANLKIEALKPFTLRVSLGLVSVACNSVVELDETLDLNQNAQKYYALYKKARLTYEHSLSRIQEAKEKLEYLESVVFNIENATSYL